MDAASSSPSKSNSGTPRSSVDHAGSPHFHGLHLRFRSSSNPSQAETPVAPTVADKSTRNKAIREAKVLLLNTVRDDWPYPALDPSFDGAEAIREPIGYALRTEGASDLEDHELENSRRKRNTKAHNPYQYETPDAIGASVNERKRKRWQLVQDEMLWNDGLRMWAAQRDAWTQAIAERPARRRMSGSQIEDLETSLRGQNTSDPVGAPAQWPLPASGLAPVLPPATQAKEAINGSDEHVGPWLPIFPPLLPEDNPVRANIKPSAYDHIYSKVVIQQLTPSVPIPLTHLTYALVDGWKADGAWPPQAHEPVAEPSNRKTAVMNIIKMRRVHGMGHHRKKASIEEEQGTVKRSIGVVKKALGVAEEKDFGIDFEDGELEHEVEANKNMNKGLLE